MFSNTQLRHPLFGILTFVIDVVVDAVKMVLHWNFHHSPTGDDPGQRLASFSGGRSLRGSGSSFILMLCNNAM